MAGKPLPVYGSSTACESWGQSLGAPLGGQWVGCIFGNEKLKQLDCDVRWFFNCQSATASVANLAPCVDSVCVLWPSSVDGTIARQWLPHPVLICVSLCCLEPQVNFTMGDTVSDAQQSPP